MIRHGARLLGNLRARPFRALAVGVLLALILAAAGVNLWAWHHFREANRLAERQQFAGAHAHYVHCLRVWRWSASTYLAAGRTARRAGLYLEVEQHLAEAGKLQGGAPAHWFPLALESLLLRAQTGDVGEVEEVLWGYVRRDTAEAPLVLEALARGYVRVLRLGTALRCLRMLLEREPDHVGALVMRGWIREGGGEPEEASKDYRRALELDPEREDARLGLARILVRDRPQEACAHFEFLIARQPGNVEALEGLAEAYGTMGEPEKARPLHDAVLAKDPGNSRALAGLGALALAAGRTADGEALLRRAIAADPANLEAHYQLYLCLVQQPGRAAEAAAQRDTHQRVEADRMRLAQIAGKRMTSTPNDPNLHYELGALYLQYGKPDVGIRWLASALKLDPTHQASHRALYDYFQRTGQADKAEQHWREIRPGTGKQPPAQPRGTGGTG
jgi:tetratricopeptide (TPR) repeat protein